MPCRKRQIFMGGALFPAELVRMSKKNVFSQMSLKDSGHERSDARHGNYNIADRTGFSEFTGEQRTPSYGGFQYRWNYDSYQRSIESRRYRDTARAIRFLMTFALCVFIAGFVLLIVGVFTFYIWGHGDRTKGVGQGYHSFMPGKTVADNKSSFMGADSDDSDDAEYSAEEIAAIVTPSVVGISAFSSEGERFGTGLIVTSCGYVVADRKIVDGCESISLHTNGGNTFAADMVMSDETGDLALIRIVAADNEEIMFTAAVFGNSDSLNAGDAVYAIGLPECESSNKVNCVTVPAVNCEITADEIIYDGAYEGIEEGENVRLLSFRREKATYGSSDDLLINKNGEIVGINTKKSSDDSESLGYAIPSSAVIPLINGMLAECKSSGERCRYVNCRAKLGITCEDICSKLAEIYRIHMGVMVKHIDPESSAKASGIETGDVIVGINGEKLETSEQLRRRIGSLCAGETITLRVYRGGEYHDITFDLDGEE